MTDILFSEGEFNSRRYVLVCDRKCEKAWGVNGRRHFADRDHCSIDFDGEDDVVYRADHEAGIAPADSGTYEGGHGKPMHPERHNEWCARECERCARIEAGENIRLTDFSKPVYNQPWKHGLDDNHYIDLGKPFVPTGDDISWIENHY